eukprot:261501_1
MWSEEFKDLGPLDWSMFGIDISFPASIVYMCDTPISFINIFDSIGNYKTEVNIKSIYVHNDINQSLTLTSELYDKHVWYCSVTKSVPADIHYYLEDLEDIDSLKDPIAFIRINGGAVTLNDVIFVGNGLHSVIISQKK